MEEDQNYLKRKAMKIFEAGETAKRVFKEWENSGESQQDFFTKGAIAALQLDIPPTEKYEELRSIQIRLDSTIHSLLKTKSKKLNIPMEKLIINALDKAE